MPEPAVTSPPRAVDVLLIGGGVAAARCARTLRREKFTGGILLVGEEPIPPYNRPPLSKELLRDDLPDELVSAEPAGWWERHGVELRTGTSAVEIDAARRLVRLAGGGSIRFERCLVATGAAPRPLGVPGGDRALLLRSLADARRLRAAAAGAGPGAPVVVVGGGFIGVEVASSLAALGLRPTIVELGDHLWGGALGDELARRAVARLHDAGVAVRLGTAVAMVTPDAVAIEGERLPAAFVVAGIGVVPRDELAAAAGLGTANGIVVDEAQRTSAAGVWAAGDVARPPDGRFEHWHGARESGERAARLMLGLPLAPRPAPWLFTEVAGHALDVVGSVPRHAAEHALAEGVVAFTDPGGEERRVVALAIEGGRLPATRARALVAEHASLDEFRAWIGRGASG